MMWCCSKKYYYKFRREIGRGSYSVVYEATAPDGVFAIKKMNPRTKSDVLRVMREVQILRFLSEVNCKSCATLKDGWIDGQGRDKYVNLVMDKYDGSLNDIEMTHCTELHIKFIMHQILSALVFIHSAGIIHRDIKMSNILVNADACKAVLCDFNMSKGFLNFSQKDGFDSTFYDISSLWFRAPELLEHKSYNEKIDLWSSGCIAANLFLGHPLFKHDSESEVLKDITKTLYDDSLPAKNTAFGSFLRCLLTQKEKRCSATEALNHPWFQGHDLSEPELSPRVFQFDYFDENLGTVCIGDFMRSSGSSRSKSL